ncbi:Btz domain [Arabidopsis thaliana x Arabidopsis arenosa]|uniref:Btz domain n=1 Tax=Arabidopsis thaliana x Arabidopsis arenosa TaxID=1240361 RepID=A0A8T2GYK6_9BRAS|nr:Btz domain [Arabidopsis thaliana x Arabidopsis arenosa]
MAPDVVEDPDYESDPDELNRSLATRRREASDDEDDHDRLNKVDHDKLPADQHSAAVVVDSDNIQDDDEDDSYDDDDDGHVDDHVEYIADTNDKTSVAGSEEDSAPALVDGDGEDQKKKEPFAVPTAGAFYMHDNRFQEIDTASNRRMRGARRLWQSRDERKWGHDKYEEMNTQQKQFDRRTSRGRGRGRGQGRGQERGHSRGNNSKEFTGNGHQNQLPKAVTRGRGPRRYEVALRNGNQAPSVQTKRSQNSSVKVSHVNSGRPPTETASMETEAIQAKKNVLASSLNSASPPFYPSGSSNNLAQKDLQAGMGRLHINENPTPTGKKFGNTKSSSLWVPTAQPSQTTSHGRGAPPHELVLYQQSPNQGDKVSLPMQIRGMPKGTDQSCTQLPGQAFDQHSAVFSLLPSSPPKTGSSKNQYLSGEVESAAETGALVAKGKGSLQPSGRGSLMYGGTQFMGPAGMAAGHGNPNFPAFLPVMQFGGQHGGVPTFGMALPGYVQPEHGTGNPEMTWLPILAAPGALGGSYCPPYAALDGSYQAHKPGLPSSAGSSSYENSSNNPNDEEPMDRPEVTNNGNSQRSNSNQNKQPRRYSEMSFSK